MFTEGREMSDNCRDGLSNALVVCAERIRVGKENDMKRKEYEIKKQQLDDQIGDITECGNHMSKIYKNIKEYNIHHQENARNILDTAIREAGMLVPDADVKGIHLKATENNRVTVANEMGQDVNLREGGGYRVILGALLRYACLKAQPDALQFMLFDETFFTLSDNTTSAMKDIFEAMKKDVSIICIEQRRNAMDGILDAEYTFTKDLEKNTTVKKTI